MFVPAFSGAADETAAIENAVAILDKANAGLVRVVLENGMICLIKEDHSAPVVSIQVWIGTGSIHEQEYLGSGLSHAIEHMTFKGTEKRSVGEMTKEINDAGGDINAYTTLDRTVFHADLPARNWRVGLDVIADAVMHSTFPEQEWVKEKQVILREFAMNKDDPDRVLDKLLWVTAFSVHPYRYPVIGYEDAFKKLTRRDLAQFAGRNYVPDNIITVIVGDVNAKEMEAGIREVFAGFERKARAPVVLPQEPLQIAPREARETGPYKVSRLEWVYHTVSLNHPDVAALDLLAEMTGSGTSSRLVREVKEKQKLVHGIEAGSHNLREAGIFEIDATLDPAKEKEAIGAICKEVESWMNTSFSKDDINKARRMLLAGELSELQTVKGQAYSYASGEFYAQNPRFSESYLRSLSRVTPEQVQAVAKKYFQPENGTLAILSALPETAAKPVSVTAVSNAPVQKILLSCGAPLLVREDHKLPFVYFNVSLGGGLLSENDSNNGITKLMSNLMIRGTKTRSLQEIAQTVDSLGGMLTPYSGYNGFGLQARCLSSDKATFMDLISDCLLNPVFAEEELDKQKKVQMAEIDQEHERPAFIAQEALRALLFPGHPYGWSPMGTKDIVEKITRTDVEGHFKKQVVSGNMVIAIFGDISLAEAKDLAEKKLAKLQKSDSPLKAHGKPTPQLPSRTKRRQPNEQAVLLVGFPGVSVKDPRSDALTILESAMSGLSSDLGIAVREKRGLAYYVGAYQQTGVEPGAFIIYAGTREEAVQDVETLIGRETARIISKGLRKEELERAKNQIIADYEMSLQDNLGTAMRCALDELYGLGFQHFFDTKRRFEAITTEDIRRAAATVLSVDMKVTSVVLPETKVGDKNAKKE
jgi:zinc protease